MANKKPLRITDRRRQPDPPKIKQYQRPGGYMSYLGQVLGLGEPGSGMGMFNDRRR